MLTHSPHIIQTDNPLSYLQQRLNYAEQMRTPVLSMVENIPVWPAGTFPSLTLNSRAVTRYANCQGQAALLEALCERERQQYALNLRPEQILISNGAFHGISLIAQHLYRPGARILCQVPMLEGIDKIFKIHGYEVVYCTPVAGESLPAAVQRYCAQARMDVLYINVPNNPTGMTLAAADMCALTASAQQQNLVLLADLVYDTYTFAGEACSSPLQFSDDRQRIYVVNSMSKSYGAPGLRIGWIVSDAANIIELSGRLETECLAACTASQEQAVALLQHGNQALVNQARRRWQDTNTALSHLPEIQFTVPSGGTQYFPQLPVNDVEAFADFMLVNFGLILVTTGNYVGVNAAHIRVPLGMSHPVLEQALNFLREGLQVWRTIESNPMQNQ